VETSKYVGRKVSSSYVTEVPGAASIGPGYSDKDPLPHEYLLELFIDNSIIIEA